MAWYYGVNNSELYGSNFSTVLADAPPPLDDVYEEDDNEIVFRSDAGKSKKYNEKAVTSSVKRRNSSNEFNDKSRLEGSVPNSRKLDHEVTEDDFGDFAGFADFGSAFGHDSTTDGEPQNWFTGEESSVKSCNAENTKEMPREQPSGIKVNDNEYADFASLQENVNCQGNQKNSPYDESDPRMQCNGSYNMESNDDFGDSIASHEENQNVTESENTSTRGHLDLEVGVISQGKTCKGGNFESKGVISSNPRDAVQCNGNIAEKRSVSHLGEPSANQSSKESHFSSPGEIPLSEQNGELSLSGMSENKESDMVQQDDRYSREPSICGHGTESERLPEKLESNNDSFGELADFNNHVKETTIDKVHKAPVMPPKFVGVGDGAVQNKTVPAEDFDDDNDFGDFGSFEENHTNAESESNSVTADLRANSPTNDKSNDDNFGGFGAFESNDDDVHDNSNDDNFENFNATISPNDKQLPILEQSVRNDCKDIDSSNPTAINSQKIDDSDKDSFGGFDGFKSTGKDSLKEDNGSDLGDFGGFETNAKDSEKVENGDDFGGFGSFESNPNESEQGDHDGDFGEFGAFESKGKDYEKDDSDDDFGNFRGSVSNAKDFQKDDNESDFEDVGAFKANAAKSQTDNKTDGFVDFGSSKTKHNLKASQTSNDNTDDFGDFGENVDDDFGDFGTCESSEKQSGLGQNSQSNNSRDFGTFKSQAEDSLEINKDDDEFGDFGAFESKKKSVDGNHSHSQGSNASEAAYKEDNTFGDLGTSLSTEFGASSSKSSSNSKSKDVNDDSGQTDNNFGYFSGVSDTKTAGFSPFSSATYHSSVSGESSPRKNVDIRQQKTGVMSHFHPGVSVVIKHVGDPISVCFPPEQRHILAYQCEDLCTRVEKSSQSNMGLWQKLESTEKEERIILSWANSFSQHKKFLSLSICPERPPPLQIGSMLKPIVSSQLPPFGGGLAGAMLMPQPPSKLPQFSSGLSFLEPIKASQDEQVQDKQAAHDAGHAEVGLPDLSFILGSGLKRVASKSDVKDNVSDTASESSSLDLDFFAPSIAQPSNGKTESRGLYEEDLLGLNIFSPSVEPRKLESPKPQNRSSVDTKKVWQHGGVTIPLSSQQNKTELSATAKSILGQLEDLTFMNSSVLMFPLKSE